MIQNRSLLIIEPECKGWNHEQVNTEFLLLLSKVGWKKITYAAEEQHIEAIRKRIDDKSILFRKILLPVMSGDSLKYRGRYKKLFNLLIEEEKPSHVVLLSSHKGNLYALIKLTQKYSDINFVVVIHALAEQLLRKYSLYDRIINRKVFDGWYLRYELNTLSNYQNVNFVTYSPMYQDYLKECLHLNSLKKTIFINHPYDFDHAIQHYENNQIVKIGLIGATVNADAIRIIRKVIEDCPEDKYEFHIIRTDYKFEESPHVVLIDNGNSVSRELIDYECQRFDYMLIAYDSNKYRVSASGVFFDAINYEVPMLMLNSPLLHWYNEKYEVGIERNNVEDLVREIEKIIKKPDYGLEQKYRDNIKNAKKNITEENKKMIGSIIL